MVASRRYVIRPFCFLRLKLIPCPFLVSNLCRSFDVRLPGFACPLNICFQSFSTDPSLSNTSYFLQIFDVLFGGSVGVSEGQAINFSANKESVQQ